MGMTCHKFLIQRLQTWVNFEGSIPELQFGHLELSILRSGKRLAISAHYASVAANRVTCSLWLTFHR